MSRHPKADLYRQERANGLTFRQIAEKYGVSHQAVAISVGNQRHYKFRPFTKESCVYPNLRKWLNDNKVCMKEFIERLDLVYSGGNASRYKDYIMGRCYPPKKTIDAFLRVTGLTYEELFQEE